MLRILLVDDHALVRRGVVRILEQDEELQVQCEEAAQAQDARLYLAQRHFDLVILDISLPEGNGLDLLKTLHRDYPRLPIVMLSMYPEEQYAIRAFTLGARGYVSKECAPEHLVSAVRKVLTGGRYLSAQLAERLAGHLASGSGNGAATHEDLTDREFSVLRLMGGGSSPSQAAAQLFLSVKTVNTYRSRIMRKLGLKSSAELINYAIRNHLAA